MESFYTLYLNTCARTVFCKRGTPDTKDIILLLPQL